jgi:hypothetical protein
MSCLWIRVKRLIGIRGRTVQSQSWLLSPPLLGNREATFDTPTAERLKSKRLSAWEGTSAHPCRDPSHQAAHGRGTNHRLVLGQKLRSRSCCVGMRPGNARTITSLLVDVCAFA